MTPAPPAILNNMPAPLPAFFECVNSGDVSGAKALFAPNAIVHDEDQVLAGAQDLTQFVSSVTRLGDRAALEPIGYTPNLPDHLVLARRTADESTPNPATLQFIFTLHDDTITEIRVLPG